MRRPTRPAARRPARRTAPSALTDSRHSGAPGARAAAKNGCVCSRTWPKKSSPAGNRVAADAGDGGLDRGRGAGQRARAGDRRRWQVAESDSGCPAHSFRLGASPSAGGHSSTRVASALGSGRHLSEISSSNAQRAQRAGHQPRRRRNRRRSSSPGRRTRDRRPGRRGSARRARGRAPRRRRGGAARRGPRRSRRRASRASPKCGGSNASICPASASARSTSASGVPAARRDHELGRIVVDDAGVGRRVEHVADALPGRRNPWCRRRG